MSNLKRELPSALKLLQESGIAPVDLAQAAIGPGMAVYSRYDKVLEPDGSPLQIRTVLQLINQALDEILTEQEGEYDRETIWALAWYEQYGMNEGPYGAAETLFTAKGASEGALVGAGIVGSRGGRVRLLRREEIASAGERDGRQTVWGTTQRLLRALDTGEEAAAEMLARSGAWGEAARDLAYRLYGVAERKGRASEAFDYNRLVVAWPEVARLAAELRTSERQARLT